MTTNPEIVAASEVKFHLLAVNFHRDKSLLKAIDARVRFGPFEIGDVVSESDRGETTINFEVSIKLDSDPLDFDARFGGYALFPLAELPADPQSELIQRSLSVAIAPYVIEFCANLTGRSGINPLILPLTTISLRPMED